MQNVVYRTIPTSNHNEHVCYNNLQNVVYRTIPTSNHNVKIDQVTTTALYIVLFLHQTTTIACFGPLSLSCISYYSYIKPQLPMNSAAFIQGCISYYSYIKPQLLRDVMPSLSVVYRTIPTSNHNYSLVSSFHRAVVYRTIPTSNHNLS